MAPPKTVLKAILLMSNSEEKITVVLTSVALKVE